MTDIALNIVQAAGELYFDILMNGADLKTGQDLESAVIISLFTDRRAEPNDRIDSDDLRGYWGDTYLPNPTDKYGSRLWLLKRAKQTQENVNLARTYALEALHWLIDDEIAKSVDVQAEIVKPNILGLAIAITRPDDNTLTFKYEYVWNQL